jgi:hypothetical protein
MKTELDTLKNYVLSLIQNEEQPQTLNLLLAEAERLPDAIMANIFSLPSDYQIRQYICWHQDMLVRQANLICKYLDRSSRTVVKKALLVILNLLKVLGKMFPEHFDNTISLPKVVYHKLSLRFQPVLQELSDGFRASGIHSQLADIALYPLTRFLQNALPARYCDSYYLLKYIAVLQQLDFIDMDHTAVEEQLCSRLLTVNYNGLVFMDYLTTKVKKEMETVALKKDKEIVLKRLKIWLKPIPVIALLVFDEDFAGLKEALLEWATLEEDALALLPDEVKKSRAISERIPLKMGISVSVLALLTRLYKIHQLYPGKKHSEILDHMVATYCTKQTTRMSRDSFYNSYKAPTLNVARALRKLLRALLDDIEHFINTGVVREDKV